MKLFDNLSRNIPPQQPIVENISIQRLIPNIKQWKNDVLFISTSCKCPTCKQYNRKYYSLYGWNKKYSKLPDFLLQRKCPDCGTIIGATMKIL